MGVGPGFTRHNHCKRSPCIRFHGFLEPENHNLANADFQHFYRARNYSILQQEFASIRKGTGVVHMLSPYLDRRLLIDLHDIDGNPWQVSCLGLCPCEVL